MLSTSDIRLIPTMPKTAAIDTAAELVADLDVEHLVRRERACERGERADHCADDHARVQQVEQLADGTEGHALEGREGEHQSRADDALEGVHHREREGAEAADRDRGEQRAEVGGVGVSEVMSGVRIQVAIAVRITTPRVIAVFWTTESMVIGPVVVGARPVSPGVPTDHWEGSVVWP